MGNYKSQPLLKRIITLVFLMKERARLPHSVEKQRLPVILQAAVICLATKAQWKGNRSQPFSGVDLLLIGELGDQYFMENFPVTHRVLLSNERARLPLSVENQRLPFIL